MSKPLIPHWLQTCLTGLLFLACLAFLVTYGPESLLTLYELIQ